MDQKGKLICFEGIDGVGKTTQVEMFVNYLQSKEQSVVSLREPGGTEIGQKIRNILLDNNDLTPTTEFLLFYSARMQLLQKKIVPLLQQGVTVVMDRFVDSTFAYQGKGRGLLDSLETIELFRGLEHLVDSCVRIDHVLYLFAPDSLLDERRANRPGNNHFDEAVSSFKRKVSEGYIQRCRERQMRTENNRDAFPVIDASGSIDAVHAQIKKWADKHIFNTI